MCSELPRCSKTRRSPQEMACRSLRACREAVVRGVTPLGKDQPLPARRALRPTTSRLAEHINTSLLDHQGRGVI